jgi:hypothetical protein
MYGSTTLPALATLGAYYYYTGYTLSLLHWLHLEPTATLGTCYYHTGYAPPRFGGVYDRNPLLVPSSPACIAGLTVYPLSGIRRIISPVV